MTRFDAATPTDRRKLFAEAVGAHRSRASPFLTIEVEQSSPDPEEPAPWVQFADGIVNADCTDEELERLKSLLDNYPAFKIDEIERPEDLEGTNVRISAKADKSRIAEFLDDLLEETYQLPPDYRAWVVEL